MTAYQNAPFSERIKTLGDTAEGVFEAWALKNNILFVRLGFNRPPFKRFDKFADEVRLMPDYACEGADAVLVEIKGCGREGLKVKEDSIRVMEFWNMLNPVLVFIYNSSKKATCLITLDELITKTDGKELRTFPDGKTYFTIPNEELVWEKWTP